MKIYLARNNVQAGPYTLDELNRMLASQEVAMSDLIWHTGMSAWQRVGDLTGGRLYYQPSGIASTDTRTDYAEGARSSTSREPRGFGDNVDLKPHAADEGQGERRRVTVAELYGRKPTESPAPKPEPIAEAEPEAWMGRHHSAHKVTSSALKETVHASIVMRFLAFGINMALFGLAVLPFFQGLFATNPDVNKMNTGDFATRLEYTQSLIERIEPLYLNLSFILLVGFLLVQIVLIASRGQSLGKLATGIRVVDADTGRVSSATKLLGMRGVVLVVIYWFASTFPFLGVALMVVNYVMALTSPTKQGWHDRLAKTQVVKADNSQLNVDASKSKLG